MKEKLMAEVTGEMAEAITKAVEDHPLDILKIKNVIGGAIIDSAKRGGIKLISYTGSSLRISFVNGYVLYIILS